MTLISNKLIPVTPMTLEQHAAGRKILDSKIEYDIFDSLRKLQLFIFEKYKNKNIKSEWIYITQVITMPLNFDKEVYYKPYVSIEIGYQKPNPLSHDIILESEVFCRLDPIKWNVEKLNKSLTKFFNNKSII